MGVISSGWYLTVGHWMDGQRGVLGAGGSHEQQDPQARALASVYDPTLEGADRARRQPRRDPALRLAASPFNADMSDMRLHMHTPSSMKSAPAVHGGHIVQVAAATPGGIGCQPQCAWHSCAVSTASILLDNLQPSL